MPAIPPATAVDQAQSKYAAFISRVHDATGIDIGVLTAWTKAEGGPAGNPLNIGPGKDYGNQAGAATATIRLLRTNGSYAPILRAASTGDTTAQLQAITNSPWDANHYRGAPDAKPGSLLFGVYHSLFSAGSDLVGAAGGAVSSAAGAVGGAISSATDIPGAITGAVSGAESWLGTAALHGLLYVVFTVGAFGLILLALARATKVLPGPAGYARRVVSGRASTSSQSDEVPF